MKYKLTYAKTGIAILFLSLLPFYMNAQEAAPQLTSYAPVSPNAASLGKYGLFPVNYNLGTVNASAPIYNINTGKQQLPINLSYNSSGIKVNELASWTGLGWTLNSGGAIIRNVKGRPGPLAPYYTSHPTPEVVDLDNAAFNKSNYDYLYRAWAGIWDSQPDEFIINAPGIIGSFYFDQSNMNQAIFKDQTRAKVTVATETLIELVRTDGTILRFGTGLDNHDARELSTRPATDFENAFDYVSAWYLTEMISPISKDTIFFRYKNKGSSDYPVATGESITLNSSSAEEIKGTYPNGSYSQKKYLERIEFNNGYVLFNSVLDREDLSDEYRLDNIKVYSGAYNSGLLVDEFNFHHSYFNRSGGVFPDGFTSIQGTGVDFNSTRMYNSRKKSLKLDSITIGINGVGPSYVFEYNTTKLPLRGSTSQDYWGYANTNTGTLLPRTTGIIPFATPNVPYDKGNGNRESDEQIMKSATLEKIIYPTGGYSVFEYEPNQYTAYVNQSEILYKSKSVTAYGPPTGSSSDCPDQPFMQLSFTAPSDNTYVSGSGKLYISFSQAQGINSTRVLFDSNQYNPPTPGPNEIYPSDYKTIDMDLKGTHTINAYEYRNAYGTNGVYDCAITSISAHWQEYGPTTQVLKTFLLGGLRVKSIKNYDGRTQNPVSIKQFEYDDHNILQPSNNRAFKKYMNNLLNISLELSTNLYYDNNIGTRPVVEYGKVTEYDIDPVNDESNGKTVYFYETVAAQRVLSTTGPIFFRHPQATLHENSASIYYTVQNGDEFSYFRTDDWRYGFLEKKEIYKGIGTTLSPYILVHKEENDYYNQLLTSSIKKNYVFKNENNPLVDYSSWNFEPLDPDNGQYGMSYVFSYYIGEVELGRKALKQSITTDYDSNGQDPKVITKDYYYDNLDHLQVTRTETTDSKGNLINTRIFYPDDITSTSALGLPNLTSAQKGAIDSLKANAQHRITEAIQQETTVNGKEKVQRTLYETSGDMVLSKATYILKGTYALGTNDMEERISYHGYDSHGNPTEVSKSNGPHIYYLWGYNGQYPIAKLENFENVDISITIQGFMDNAVAKSLLDKDRSYGSVGQEGALRGALSELRIALPDDVLMTGYTYDPLIGVTSIIDPKGSAVYYEYDNKNRLMEIRDTDNKLVKDFHYHYITE